jgi:hypothetical protein
MHTATGPVRSAAASPAGAFRPVAASPVTEGVVRPWARAAAGPPAAPSPGRGSQPTAHSRAGGASVFSPTPGSPGTRPQSQRPGDAGKLVDHLIKAPGPMTSETRVTTWAKKLLIRTVAAGYTAETLVTALPSLVEPHRADWVLDSITELRERTAGSASWNDVVVMLIERFENPLARAIAARDFASARQEPGESGPQFFARYDELRRDAGRVFADAGEETEAVTVLSERLADAAAGKALVDEVVNRSVRHEHMRWVDAERWIGARSMTRAVAPREALAVAAVGATGGPPSQTYKKGPGPADGCAVHGRRDGLAGHTNAECRNKVVKCFRCQKPGHRAQDCTAPAPAQKRGGENRGGDRGDRGHHGSGRADNVAAVADTREQSDTGSPVEDIYDMEDLAEMAVAYADGLIADDHVAATSGGNSRTRPSIKIKGPRGTVVCLLDTGSQLTLLTPTAVDRLGLAPRHGGRVRTLRGALPGWTASSRTTAAWQVGHTTVDAVVIGAIGGGFDAILGVDAITNARGGGVKLGDAVGSHVCALEETAIDLVAVADDAYETRPADSVDLPEGHVRMIRKGFDDGPALDSNLNELTVWDYDKWVARLLKLLYAQAYEDCDPSKPRARVNTHLPPITLWVKPDIQQRDIPWINKEFGRPAWVREYLQRWIPENVATGVIEVLPIDPRNPADRPKDHACVMLHVVGTPQKPRVVLNGKPLSQVFDMSRYVVEDEVSLAIQQEETADPATTIRSTLDYKSGFSQLPLDTTNGLRVCTVVNGSLVRFRALGMGFGVSPSIFHRFVDMTLLASGVASDRGARPGGRAKFVDDVTINDAAKPETRGGVTKLNIDAHGRRLERMLLYAATDRGMVYSVHKTIMLSVPTNFGGVRVTTGRLEVLPSRRAALATAPAPKTGTQLRHFIGSLTFVVRFVPSLTRLLAPLHKVSGTRGDLSAVIEQARVEEIVQQVRDAVNHCHTLVVPGPDDALVLAVDTSTAGTGAVLLAVDTKDVGKDGAQRVDPLKEPRIVTCFSAALTQERLCEAPNSLELGGIVRALTAFDRWLSGRRFILLTDHKGLVSTLNKGRFSRVVARHYRLLLGYEFICAYLPGNRMEVADALSRAFPPVDDRSLRLDSDEITPIVDVPPQLLKRGLGPGGKAPDLAVALRLLGVVPEGHPIARQVAAPDGGAASTTTDPVGGPDGSGVSAASPASTTTDPVGGPDGSGVSAATGAGAQAEEVAALTRGAARGVAEPRGHLVGGQADEVRPRQASPTDLGEPDEPDDIHADAEADPAPHAAEGPPADGDTEESLLPGCRYWNEEYDTLGDPIPAMHGQLNPIGSSTERFTPRRAGDRARITAKAHSMGHVADPQRLAPWIRDVWRFDWRTLVADISETTGGCTHCARMAVAAGRYSAPHADTYRFAQPGAVWAIDTWSSNEAGPNGEYGVLVVVDRGSGYTIVRIIMDKSARTCGGVLAELMLLLGAPVCIVTDNGGEYRNQLLQAFTDTLGIRHKLAVAHRAQGNSLAENGIRRVFDVVKRLMSEFSGAWTEYVSVSAYYINLLPFSGGTGASRHELFFGRPAIPPGDYRAVNIADECTDEDVRIRVEQIRWLREILYPGLAARRAQATQAVVDAAGPPDAHRLRVGDMVMRYEFDRVNKLSAAWTGPYRLAAVDRLTRTYQVADADGAVIPRKLHRSMLRAFRGTVDETALYRVERILEEQQDHEGVWVLVKWAGHPATDPWWIKADSLAEPELLRQFRTAKAQAARKAREARRPA